MFLFYLLLRIFECEDFVRCFCENSETIEHVRRYQQTGMSIIEELLNVDSKISNLFCFFRKIGMRGVKIPYLPYVSMNIAFRPSW